MLISAHFPVRNLAGLLSPVDAARWLGLLL